MNMLEITNALAEEAQTSLRKAYIRKIKKLDLEIQKASEDCTVRALVAEKHRWLDALEALQSAIKLLCEQL